MEEQGVGSSGSPCRSRPMLCPQIFAGNFHLHFQRPQSTTDFLNIFLFRNSAAAVAGFLLVSRPPAKLLKCFIETLASFRPARLPAPLTRNRARETHRPIKTQTRNAHSIWNAARCLFVGAVFGGPRNLQSRRASARNTGSCEPPCAPPKGFLCPFCGVVSGPRLHPARPPAARRCAPEFQKNTRSFSALPSALS